MNNIKRLMFRPESFIYLYFFVFTLFFALNIKLGSAPDETHHYNFIKYYADNSADPFLDKQETSFSLGAVNSEVSYLYHYLMSFVYRLADFLNVDTLVSVRFVNILLGVGTLVGLNYIAKALKITKRIRLALLFLISSIPMFMFLSSSISYDNLVISMSVLAVCLTLSLKSKLTLPKILGLVSIILLGPIVKKAFLPISMVFFFYAVYLIYKNYPDIKKQVVRLYKNNKIMFVACIGIFLISLSAFSFKYISNVINYGSIEPKCAKVLSHDECLNNPIYNRTQNYNSQSVNVKPVSEDKYLVSWINLMVDRTYGLFGHRKFETNPSIGVLTLVTTYILIVLFFRRISWRSFKSTIIPILFIFYISVLVYTNYKSYLKRGDIALAVQGRYAFPVLLPFILFIVSLYNRTLNKRLYQYSVFGLIILFSLLTGPLYILKGIDPGWLN